MSMTSRVRSICATVRFCHSVKSTEARKLFTEWQKRTAQHAADVRSLDQQRDAYASANAAERKRMSTAILGLEAKVEADAVAVEQMENEIRRLEQEKIYK